MTLHSNPEDITTLHITSLHNTTLHKLPNTTLHKLRYTTLSQTTLHYPSQHYAPLQELQKTQLRGSPAGREMGGREGDKAREEWEIRKVGAKREVEGLEGKVGRWEEGDE